MKKIFLDIALTPDKNLPKWLIDGRKFLEREIGKPCPVFGVQCCSCETWLQWARLAMMFDKRYLKKVS